MKDKKYFNAVKNFTAHSVFQGKRKLLKNPECKKYVQYSENFQGKLRFQGKHKLKNPERYKIFQYSEKFQGKLFFRASASCSKFRMIKNIHSIQ